MTLRLAALAAALTLLAGCGGSTAGANGGVSSGGGSGTGSSGGSGSGNTQPIQGVATPSSVAVVTATNVN